MSYDLTITARYWRGVPYLSESTVLTLFDRNITYNLCPMLRAAGFEFDKVKGATARRIHRMAALALAAMENDPPKFKAMNPPNGWGTYEGAIDFLQDLKKSTAGVRFAKALVC